MELLNRTISPSPLGSTVSLGGAASLTPRELSALSEHLHVCTGLCGRLFAVRCTVDSVRGFIAARLVTTLLGLLALCAVAALLA